MDAPAIGNPADPRKWIESMTRDQKRWLVGRLETQALYGTRVYLLGTSGDWSRVAVPSQPTPRTAWGYPGWLPTVQLTPVRPAPAPWLGVVIPRTTWMWASPSWSDRVMEISYGTRLPVVAVTESSAEVVAVDGSHLYVHRSLIVLHAAGVKWHTPTGAGLVAEAKKFLGLPYLWAGTSGFGFDCSGLVHTVYRRMGIQIPRDADAQFAVGTKILLRSNLRPGDLVFFRNSSGAIHHVGMYIGDGRMIDAPQTGMPVRTVSLSTEPYRSEFAGGRRYLH